MFTKGEINIGFIFSTTVGVFLAGVLLHFALKKMNKPVEKLTIAEEIPSENK